MSVKVVGIKQINGWENVHLVIAGIVLSKLRGEKAKLKKR